MRAKQAVRPAADAAQHEESEMGFLSDQVDVPLVFIPRERIDARNFNQHKREAWALSLESIADIGCACGALEQCK